MSNPRTPLALARITGRDQVAKARFANRREPFSPPIGGPPEWITDPLQRDAWHEFRREVPWLCEAHSCLVAIACRMRAKLARGTASDKELNLLRQCLGAMGAVPNGRLSVPPAEDPDDGLFTRYSGCQPEGY